MKRFAPALLLLVGGCAQLPHDLPPRPEMKTPEAAATMESLSAGIARRDRPDTAASWWHEFGRPDLDRLIETALRDQPDLGAAQARLDAAKRAERLARLAADVHYSTDVSMTRERLSDNGLFPTSLVGKMYTQTDISQTISYDFDWWGRNRALLRAAGDERQAALDEAGAVRLDIAAAVADTYFAWADVAQRLAQARELAACHSRELNLLERRFSLGLDAAGPALDARRKLDLDEDRVGQLGYLDRSLRYRMSALTGSDPDHANELAIPSLDARLPKLPSTLPLGWLARRPDVAALRARAESSSARSDATKAEFYPNLDLKLLVGLESLDLGKLFESGSVMGSFGPALHLPLFNTNTLQAKLGRSEAEYASAVAAYNHAILDAARQSADAYALVASLEQRSTAQRSALQADVRIHQLATQREALGLTGPLDALQAESAVLEQRMNDTETQAARLRARVALFRAIGGDTNLKD